MCSLDLDPCTIWKEKVRTARIPHRCAGCGSVIQPGELYLDHNNLFEGDWSHEAACAPCTLTRDWFADAHGQSFAPSMLEDTLRECIGERDDDGDGWRVLLAGMLRRRRLTQGWRKHLAERWAYDRERRARVAAALSVPAAVTKGEG